MDIKRLTYLIEAYRAGLLPEEEQPELFALIREDAGGSETMPILLSMLERQAPEDIDRAQWQPVLEAVLGADKSGVQRRRRVVALRWWMMAASVLVLVCGMWLWRGRKIGPSSATAPALAIRDVAPGGNRAVLTLAGGKTLVLDSLHIGLIAQQAGAHIVKLADGKVAYRQEQTSAVQYNTLTTPRGGQYRIELTDGTVVWLNAASSITYPTAFTGRERRVSVTGEVYLDVAHRAGQPFVVQAGEEEIAVLGTAFNVNAYSDEPGITTTLVQGAVRVGSAGKVVTLGPGEQARVTRTGGIAVNPHADIEEAVGWKEGLFKLHESDVAMIMRQIARWYDVDVVYEGGVPAGSISGDVPRGMALSNVLKVLKLSGVHCRIEGRKVYVSSN